jgi:anti-sigma regulatory factor (Ser/Thr protein kinase)
MFSSGYFLMEPESPKSTVLEMLKAEMPLFTAQLTTETETAAISEVLAWFEQCRPPHSSARVWLECQTALVEAYVNVLEHAHRNLPAETPIMIQLLVYKQAIELQICDRGTAFDFDEMMVHLPDQVAITAERGRGLLLLRRTMDYLAYSRCPDDRNCLVMIRLL